MSDHQELFRHWLTEGWRFRRATNVGMQKNPDKYRKRMQYEYEIISAREGFVDYFCIVSDLVRYAKDSDIAVGPGRGSVAGSLVAYLLRITEIDPVPYPMLFERFLDPTRTDAPDIDLDFDDERRGEIFEYAAEKYGVENVANIGTSTYYRGKNSLDDVARVYHIPKWKVDSIKGKLLERAAGHPRFTKTLEDTYNSFAEVQSIVEETPEFAYAPRLEGNIRGFGIHAAGMVVSSVPINKICAMYERQTGAIENRGRSIAFDKYDATYLGLLKIDILGLRTMGMISKVCELAGISLDNLYRTELNDPETMEMFRNGDVLGIFQFEGTTTRRILKAVAPEHIMHLSDVNALARPGADDKSYVKNKRNGIAGVKFSHEIIERHTTKWPNTYGTIVYEEQVLMVLRDLGGFIPAELNKIRKVIHDKLGSSAFNEYYQKFIKGAATQGLSESEASVVWDTMVNASGYSFNLAHSIAYAHIGYWQAWLKTHYPAEFYTGQLLKASDELRRQKLIQEAQLHGINVEIPNLLYSQGNWTLSRDRKSILAGFGIIKGIGPATIKGILEWREEGEKRWGIDDFFPEWDDLIEIRGIGPKTIESIKAFINSDDPFGVGKTKRVLDEVRKALRDGALPGVPEPTHISVDVPTDGTIICFTGIIRKKKYYDAVEQLKKRTPEEISTEDALLQLDDPHLLKYVALYCEDEYGEQIVVRVSRWKYPSFASRVDRAKVDHDIVVAVGKTSDFGGTSIQARELVILEP